MLEKLLFGIKALAMDSSSVLTGYDLGLANLLLGDAMLMINFAEIIKRELALRKATMEHLYPLLEGEAGPLAYDVRVGQVFDLTNSGPLGIRRSCMDMF